ncbi:unnamed protein product [Notodromas monacha]|uniref:Uncharacterized protein n=1 Tax=Notodromas monacha TaxID=399045 RepID=A0A7R9BJA0_9CRUS|nr:unnamed protein product [Notodromas monacha]CAG0915672.1 unnamed protein product [Notodromas monacha]
MTSEVQSVDLREMVEVVMKGGKVPANFTARHYGAADLCEVIESVLEKNCDTESVVNVLNFVLSGLSAYQRQYVILRVVPKFVMPLVLGKAVSFRLQCCLKNICECQHNLVVFNVILKPILEVILSSSCGSEVLFDIAKMLTRKFISPSSNASAVMIGHLCSSQPCEKVLQLMESLINFAGDERRSSPSLNDFVLANLAKYILASPPALRVSGSSARISSVLKNVYEKETDVPIVSSLIDSCVQLCSENNEEFVFSSVTA